MNLERAITFTAKAVRDILDSRKTQTRRVVKHQAVPPPEASRVTVVGLWCHWENDKPVQLPLGGYGLGMWTRRCPWGEVGQRLWVQEQFYCDDWSAGDLASARVGYLGDPPADEALISQWREQLFYRADGEPEWEADGPTPWRSATQMPRWASRISLEMTRLRVERVRSISWDDAVAEGFCGMPDRHPAGDDGFSPIEDFEIDWDPGSWRANDWVWVMDFKVVGRAD
jgi:hypothetical protein